MGHAFQGPWAGQSFPTDYSRLRPADRTPGHDYVCVAAAERIECSDPAARNQRPLVVER